MTEKIKNFRDLDVWKKGIEIVKDIYSIAGMFPKQELYGLRSQMQRSSISIPSNIAEGFNRFHNKEYKQFLYVSFGSCAELETQLNIAKRLNFAAADKTDKILDELIYLSKMIMTLIRRI